MNKLIVLNLKNSLNDENVENYSKIISKNKYNNLVICPNIKYISYFNSDSYYLGTQNYYENINCSYVILNHKDSSDDLTNINKIKDKAINENKKVILCIDNEDIIDKISINKNIIIAYEPNNMVGSNKNVDIDLIKEKYIKIKNKYNNLVIYGGNVNEENIYEILKIYDGVLIGRLSYNPLNITNIMNKFTKNI